MSSKRLPPKPLRPLVEGLERRVLYSADAAALCIEVPAEPLEDSDAYLVHTQPLDAVQFEASQEIVDASTEEFNLVVLDADLEDVELLREAAEQGGAEVLIFHSSEESAEDVLQRISSVAVERGEDFDSISIVSHGSGGQFQLGGDLVTQAEAEGSIELWQELGSHLDSGANLYLYGCNVADGSGDGQALLDTLADATGADVFASSDLSGAGGDWDLEAASSGDEAEAAAGLAAPIDASIAEAMTGALADYAEANWSGSQTYDDGAISFTLTYQQGGSIDWNYDGATNTLTITDLNGGGPSSDLYIVDNNGGLIVDQLDLNNFRGTLISDADIGSINFGLGNPTSLIVGGGAGTVGTINYAGPVDNSGTIEANVGTIDISGGGIDNGTTIRVEGDLGDMQIDGDLGAGASLEVTGNLPTLDITGDVTGSIDVGGDMTSLDVSGNLGGTVDVGGDLFTLTVVGGGDATIVVGGDLDDANWSNDFIGTLTVTNTVGEINIVDDGVNEYSNDFTPPTLVFYDGSANHGTPENNNAPTADPLSIVMLEDGTAVVTLAGSDIDAGDAIETFRVETLPTNGTLYLGTTALTGPTDIPAAQIAGNLLTFEPDADWNGATSFEFSTHDGEDWSASTAVVSITVGADNDAPTADPLSIVMLEDGTAVVTLAGSDIDAGDAIETFRVETLPTNGTLYLGTTALTGPTDIPAAQIAGNLLTFEPDADWNGATSFEFSTHDGEDWSASTAVVSITVGADNDAPTADPLSIVMLEDGTAVVTLAGSDIDAGDAIETFRVETLPTNGTLYLGTTALTGPTDIPAAQIAGNLLTFEPDADWNGATSFEFSTHDGEDWSASTAVVSITVGADNDAPTADPLSIVMLEDSTAVVTLAGSDIDAGDAIETFRVETLPTNGTLYLGTTALTGPTDIPAAQIAGNLLTFEPDADWNGATSFEFSTHDGEDWSASTAVVSITVGADNDAPTADPLSIVMLEDGMAVVTLAGSDIDAGDAIETFRVETLPTNGTLYLGTTALTGPTDIPAAQIAGNLLTFEPDADWNGATSFEFSTHDGEDWSASTAVVSITVGADNDAPTADPLSIVMLEDGTAVVTLAGSDIDAGDAIETFRVETLPTNGTLYLGTTALTGPTDIPAAQIAGDELTFQPDSGWAGSTGFVYRAHDGEDWSATSAAVGIESIANPEVPPGPVIEPEPEPDPEPEPEPVVEPELENETIPEEEVVAGPEESGSGGSPPASDGVRSDAPSTFSDRIRDGFSDGNHEDDEVEIESGDDALAVDLSGRDENSPEATKDRGITRAVRRLELDVPPVGYVENEVSRQMLERLEKEELRVSGFEAASVALSATVVAIMSRSASLVAMAVSSIPAWHRFDPLAVVAMSESSRRAWAQRQKDAEKDEDDADERLREMLGD